MEGTLVESTNHEGRFAIQTEAGELTFGCGTVLEVTGTIGRVEYQHPQHGFEGRYVFVLEGGGETLTTPLAELVGSDARVVT